MESIQRFPKTFNKSLQAWNAADELLVEYSQEEDLIPDVVINDAFGYLTLSLNGEKTQVVHDFKSQKDAILFNAEEGKINPNLIHFYTTFDPLNEKAAIGWMKIPKSLELFELFLRYFIQNAEKESVLVCGFMTKHFTPQLVKLGEHYFEEVEQTKAKKKARLLILRKPKPLIEKELTLSFAYGEETYHQWFGVFSSGGIDFATQFLLDQMVVPQKGGVWVDLACGNGVLGKEANKKRGESEVELIWVDDSKLAVESARLNMNSGQFYHQYHLGDLENESVDWIISNPPFHTGHEIDLSVPFQLFKEAGRCLKKGGEFQMVANRHLQYKPMLNRYFNSVSILAQNQKFVVYRCVK